MNTGLQKFVIIPGNKSMDANYREQFPIDFFNAAGSDQDEEFYNAIGDGIRDKRARKNQRVTSKANLRTSKGRAVETKANAKLSAAKANILAAKSLSNKQSDADLLKSLSKSSAPKKSVGMSTQKKVLIGAGIVVAIGITAFVIYKVTHKKAA